MKNCSFLALLFAASMLSFTTIDGDKIVIEGQLTNVPDSMVLELYEWDGNSGERVAIDTVIDGKFRFEVESSVKSVHRAGFNSNNVGLRALDLLWVEPGAKVKIIGDGLEYYNWDVKSNVKAQINENRFREATKSELSLLFKGTTQLMLKTEEFNSGSRSEEERKQFMTFMNEINREQNDIYSDINDKEFALLPNMTPDEAWASRLYNLSLSFKQDNDSIAKVKAMEQYARMDETLKATFFGQKVTKSLFPPRVVQIGDMVPDIELKYTLGNSHSLKELKGKYLLLDFWSSGCGPCIMSFPELKELSEQMKESLEVVSISQDSDNAWRKASARHGITWKNWNDLKLGNGIFMDFGVRGIPHYFIISPEGKIVASQIGYSKGLLKYVLLPKYLDLENKTTLYRSEEGKQIIDYPTVTENNINCMYIRTVELTDKSTDVTFKVFYNPNMWVRIADTSHLITDGGERLPISKATGITLNKETFMPESGTIEFTLHFPALPQGCSSFSYYEENVPNGWNIKGIKVKKM